MDELIITFEALYGTYRKNLEGLSNMSKFSFESVENGNFQLEFQGWNSRINHSKKELNTFLSCLSKTSFRELCKRTKYPVQYIE